MAMIRRVHLPLKAPEDVIPHLGAAHHWKEGRSAKLLIDQWWAANDVPGSVRALLDQSDDWAGAVLLDAFAERSTSLNVGRPSHSQSDMLAIMRLSEGLGALSIEAKVDEGFDKTVEAWMGNGSEGKRARLAKLCKLFGIDENAVGQLRYQLLHRTASAVIEAKRYRAAQAAMIVQSWSEKRDGFSDFCTFAEAIGMDAPASGTMTKAVMIGGVDLRLGWSSEAG